MNLRLCTGTLALVVVMWAPGCTNKKDSSPATSEASSAQLAHEDPEGYFTCPMHPQVHEHKPGQCPICGMALVKVPGKKQEVTSENMPGNGLHATDQQLNLAGIGKHTVEKKDLLIVLPVSGRLISAKEVVFQVYESDLQVLRAGLEFSGRAASSPDDELTGEIRQVDNLVDPSSRTVRVLGRFNKSAKRVVIDGAFHGEVRSTVQGQIAIPENAVLHTGRKDLVYIFSDDNQLKPVGVTLGRKALHEYQVLSGLNEGDVISSGPNFLIDSESKIRMVTDPGED